MKLRIATWNINSVRRRLDLVARFAAESKVDVLCLQEIKVHDDAFPLKALKDMGFKHHAIYGQKAYHGVAIFSKAKAPLGEITRRTWCEIDEARHLSCTLPGGIELHNFYVPAGGDDPDPEANAKFAHKLQFMQEVTDWFADRQHNDNRMVLVGDLNVAPLETDVWSHKQLLKVVSHTPVEVEHMQRWMQSHDWIDAVRRFIPPEEKLYSWWSYRSKDWSNADKGRRLDHVWVTPALQDGLKKASVMRDARGWEAASDHCPVIVDLDVPA